MIEHCLLAGLHAVEDSALPMLTSDFYAKVMLPNRPAGTSVDIKKTSYKKLSKLLAAFEKKGLLKQKMVHKQENISHVHRTHELYKAFKPAGGTTQAQAEAANASGGDGGKVSIEYSYRVPSSLRPIFVAGPQHSNKEIMLTEHEVAAGLLAYAERQGLAPVGTADAGTPTPAPIKLDQLLVGLLYNKGDRTGLGNEAPYSDLLQRLLSKLTVFHKVSRTTSAGVVEVVKKGAIKGIKIGVEERQGGRKHVTHVTGMESFALDPEELSSVLQRKFAAACSVNKLPGKQETGRELGVQGALAKEIAAFLQAEYGIDAKHIEVLKKPGQK